MSKMQPLLIILCVWNALYLKDVEKEADRINHESIGEITEAAGLSTYLTLDGNDLKDGKDCEYVGLAGKYGLIEGNAHNAQRESMNFRVLVCGARVMKMQWFDPPHDDKGDVFDPKKQEMEFDFKKGEFEEIENKTAIKGLIL